MAGPSVELRWVDGSPATLQANIQKHVDMVKGRAAVIVGSYGDKAEREMKRTAPWTDRTGDARKKLSVRFESSHDGRYTLTGGHGVHYGQYLEFRWGGKYAVVGPVMTKTARLLMAKLKKDLGK